MRWPVGAVVLGVTALSSAPAAAEPFAFGLSAAGSPAVADRELTLRRAADGVSLVEDGQVIQRRGLASHAPLVIDGGAGNDTLRVDFGGGNPAPGAIRLDGGAQAGGQGDSLEIVGGSFDRAGRDVHAGPWQALLGALARLVSENAHSRTYALAHSADSRWVFGVPGDRILRTLIAA